MSKPGDFLIGVQDFFAVILPGAIATWLVSNYLPARFVDSLRLSMGDEGNGPARWAVFFLSSYTLGHFVFMLGSRLDEAYDRWRKRTKPTDSDLTYQAANKLRESLTPALKGAEFSTLKWAKTYVQLQSPAAYGEIERLEANSKFFRSLIVIAVALTAHFFLRERQFGLAAAAFVLGGLSLKRFFDQRWKLTELSYATAVILHATRPKPSNGAEAHVGEAEEDEGEAKE
jgi:hypothetical protein